MKYIKILSLPTLKFAHVFGVEKYVNTLYARENFIEISFVAEGIFKKNCDGREYIARKGDFSCNTYDSLLKVRADGFHEHHTVGFEVEFERSDTFKEGFLTIPKIIPNSENTAKAIRLIDKIIELSENHDTPSALLSGLFLELLGEIDIIAKKPTKNLAFTNQFYTDKAKKFIFANLKKPITQKQIAEHLGVTPQYLCSVFKASAGESIIKYINKLKLKQIQILIDRENVKLHQAATIMGYSDPNYVSRLFKIYYGKNVTDLKRDE